MKRTVWLWQLGGLTFTAVLGTILHFLYGWVESPITAIFSAVNESTWEHMKLAFVPMFIFAIIQSFFFKDEFCNFWNIKTIGTVVATLLIPVLFYTLNGIFGNTPGWINVLLFFLSIGAGYALEWWLFEYSDGECRTQVFAIVTFAVIMLLFAVFTFFSPQIPLFQDPITRGYGVLQ